VIFGESKSFAFTPNNGYTVANVLVDSVSLGSVSSYTFANVTANHKISVTFRQLKKPVAVTAAATELTQTSVRFNGSVNPNGLATTYRFEFGLTSSYGVATPFLTAATGSALVSVYNPMSSLAPGTTYHYRISATNADGTAIGNDTLFTTFPTSVKVTASAGPNGKITPSGTVPVSFGGNQSFVISPNKGFRVATVLVDTSVVGTARSLQLSNVTKDQAVSVTFIPYSTTSVEQLGNDIPHEFALQQNYPNPFNPSTTINYSLPKSAFVVLQIFNALGQEVSSLVNEQLDAGTYQVTWNSSGAPSGIYFYRLQVRQMDGGEVGGFVETKRMILVK
jgi:hypothetical protein